MSRIIRNKIFACLCLVLITSAVYASNYHAVIAVQGDHIAIRLPEGQVRMGDKYDIIRLGHGTKMIVAEAVVDKITVRHCRMRITDTRPGYFAQRGDYAILQALNNTLKKPAVQKKLKSSAITARTGAKYKWGFRVGLNLDATVDYMPGTDYQWNVIDPDISQGLSFGGQFDIKLNDYFSLSTTPTYSEAHSNWMVSTYTDNDTFRTALRRDITYIGIPVNLKLHFGIFYILGGVEWLSLQSVKANSQLNPGTSGDPFTETATDVSDQYKSSAFAYNLGAGIQVQVGDNSYFVLESRLVTSQDNIINSGDAQFGELKPGGGQIMAGFIFNM